MMTKGCMAPMTTKPNIWEIIINEARRGALRKDIIANQKRKSERVCTQTYDH